jgi:hypothetical protein
MIDVAPLIGLRIRLRRTIDTPCGACGNPTIVIGPGAGPHVASLRCADCEKHRGWLPVAIVNQLLAFIDAFGTPPEIVTIRDSEFASRE